MNNEEIMTVQMTREQLTHIAWILGSIPYKTAEETGVPSDSLDYYYTVLEALSYDSSNTSIFLNPNPIDKSDYI
jgi:hypothetical protein